jgi:hypothetical protein
LTKEQIEILKYVKPKKVDEEYIVQPTLKSAEQSFIYKAIKKDY